MTKTVTKKIFVGGLASDTKIEDLQTYFGTFGKVSWSVFLFSFLLGYRSDISVYIVSLKPINLLALSEKYGQLVPYHSNYSQSSTHGTTYGSQILA